MLDKFITKISTEFQQEGYLIELNPKIPGVQALLYSRSPGRVRLGAAKVEDHFLFVDWDNAAFGRLDQLLEIYRRFSSYVNQGFRTPHILRVQIPNLALVAVSRTDFPDDAIRFARMTSLNPWYGGEAGQIILVEIVKKQLISLVSLYSGRSPRPGAFALGHAAEIIRSVSQQVFNSEMDEGTSEM
jgi:hypothetical protein